LRDWGDECRNESEGIANEHCQFMIRVECLASQHQRCIAGNELETYL